MKKVKNVNLFVNIDSLKSQLQFFFFLSFNIYILSINQIFWGDILMTKSHTHNLALLREAPGKRIPPKSRPVCRTSRIKTRQEKWAGVNNAKFRAKGKTPRLRQQASVPHRSSSLMHQSYIWLKCLRACTCRWVSPVFRHCLGERWQKWHTWAPVTQQVFLHGDAGVASQIFTAS